MSSTKTLLADFKGLVTAPGLLMRAEASCTLARNALFDAPGLLRKRPGFSRLQYGMGGPIYQLHSSPILDTRFFAHYGSTTNPGTVRLGDGTTGASTLIPSIDPQSVSRPAALRQRMALLGQSHYLTSDEGSRRIESALTSVRYAGMPRGLQPSTANMNAATFSVLQAANPWLAQDSAVAYRVTWHRLDDAGQELGGPPTGRTTVRNIAGTSGFVAATMSVRLRVPVPYEFGSLATALTTSYFFRLWRSRSVEVVDPDDEMSLVLQYTLTAGDITAGYVQVNDVTPDTLLSGAPKLHTNPVSFPDGEANLANGQLNADDPPPSANCVASWRECLWYADTEGKSASTCQLISVGGTGLVAGDTVSFDGGVNNITAVAGAPAAADEFTVVTGLATLALNLEATARNMVEAWNVKWRGVSEVSAFYTSIGTEQPGIIFMECARQSDVTAGASCSRSTAFRIGTPNTRIGGSNSLHYSKAARADACALVNVLQAGAGQATILQLVPFREFLLVFTDQGIYRVTGASWADFNIAPFDLSFRLLGRDLVAVADDRVYAWCYEGIVEIDDGGARVISLPIEPTLTALLGATPSTYAPFSFAIAYRLAHRVTFFASASVGNATRGYTFDTRTRAWSTTEFTRQSGGANDYQKSCGVVRFSDDRLVLANYNFGGGDAYVFVERRALDNTDYQDTDAGNVTDPVPLRVTFQYNVPDVEGAVHWQQLVMSLDGGEFAWRALPTALTLSFQTEWASSGNLAVAPSAAIVRYELPRSVRRGNRLVMTVANSTAEACGFNGLSQSIRLGSKFARRT